jgi:crotonobetainyl-CoA:carnitine CoA-transferase CaiB-like acyl-CoA transferase
MKALSNIRLLDLTHMVSGPYAGMILADLGAETIKVEPPASGEATRRLLEKDPANNLNGFGAYFITLNRNKKSITLDLKSEKGREIFYELVKSADVVLNNFSVGVLERLKIDHSHLSAHNPRIITCSLTGFGETGPHKERTSFDMVAQGMGGGMSITGQPGDPPTRYGIPIADLTGGLMAVIGILAALNARQVTGRGQHVDISMLDTQISLLTYVAAMHFLSGIIPERLGNEHFVHVPYDTFECSDGHIIIAILVDNLWEALVKALPAEDLDTAEHKTQPGRLKNKALITRRLNEILSTNTQSYWLERLQAARVPCSPVYNVAQAVRDPQVLARNMIVDVQHPLGGTARIPGNPVKLSDTSDESFTPPPLLGQHTDEVLKSLLGKSEDELERLREAGII